MIPGADWLPPSVEDLLSEQRYWLCQNVPLAEFTNINFVEAFVKRGKGVEVLDLLKPFHRKRSSCMHSGHVAAEFQFCCLVCLALMINVSWLKMVRLAEETKHRC